MPDSRPTADPVIPAREQFEAVARTILLRCDELARFSDRMDGVQRTFCSASMAHVHERVRQWMQLAGMHCHMDAATNLIGRYDAQSGGSDQVLLVGSHLDTVPNAGRYDGVLGVVLGLGLVELLHAHRVRLPLAIDVIGFCEEEGIRYAMPFLGSLAVSGQFHQELLQRTDEDGTPLSQAIAQFGGDPDRLFSAQYDPAEVAGFLEAHIEQGPVLDRCDLPVAVVTAIAGQTRASVTFTGQAGHAGTVPVAERKDALVAASHFIADVESIAIEEGELFATIGRVEVVPNIGNVIPGEARLRLDIRHEDDARRSAAYQAIIDRGHAIARSRHLRFEVDWQQQQPAVAADPQLRALIHEAVAASGHRTLSMPSGAGHDAAVMAARFPIAMLFVRCQDGISHHPDESVSEGDVAVALEVLWRTVVSLASSKRAGLECASPQASQTSAPIDLNR